MNRARVLAVVLLLLAVPRTPCAETPEPAEVVRIGVSQTSFGRVTRNDARAALQAWAFSVAKERKLRVAIEVEVYEGGVGLADAMRKGTIDGASMTAAELLEYGEAPEYVFANMRDDGFLDEYVLIVRDGSQARGLADLRQLKLVRHVSSITSVALPWLETELGRAGLGRAATFFSAIDECDSASKTVLRVFFGQAAVGLVTRNAFELAGELNPQLRRNLKVLRVSPAFLCTMFFFRTGHRSPIVDELEEAVVRLHETPAGRQVLTVFQGARMSRQPIATFDATRRLLLEYDQLVKERVAPAASRAGPGPPSDAAK